METAELLDRARAAFAARAWQDSYDGFDRADRAMSLEPVDLERLATAAYLSGHDAASTDAWSRAHQSWHDRDDEQRAVRCAFWLGFALMQKGEMAQGGGWLARAARIVAEHELDTVERGYLLVPEGLAAIGSGDPGAALERFIAAESLARRFGDPDLAALGTLGQGEALLRTGRASDGLRLFDEAMVAVISGETSPMISGLVYCAVIDSCQQVFDLRRACEWTAALDKWCAQQPGLVPYRGQCLVHRAQVLQLRGEWRGAVVEAEQARERLSDPPHPGVGMAHYQLGELCRLRGDVTRAEEAYRLAHATGREPQPGLALLRLGEGRIEAANAGIQSALDAAGDRMSRARLLPAYTEIMLAVGRLEEAGAAAAELDELAGDGNTTMLAAIADQARGAVLLASGDASAAAGPLRAALDAWRELEAPYEAAQVRALLAAACWQLGDLERAELECDVARHALDQLGAATALARLERLLAAVLAGAASEPAAAESPLSDRELEVLRLVAAGRTNREIGRELAISEKTVERHLGNIFIKFGVSNRAAATARAFDEGLL